LVIDETTLTSEKGKTTMRKYNLGFVLFSLLILAGCSANKMQTKNIYKNSKIQTYLPYSDLARISHLSLEYDGYLIGIEKGKENH
jgi:hypothetical protein